MVVVQQLGWTLLAPSVGKAGTHDVIHLILK